MTESFLNRTIGVTVSIKEVRNIGNGCLVQLNNRTDKQMIMKNKHKLKNTKDSGTYINDDMSREERKIQAKIRERAKTERTSGKEVKIGFQKIIINGSVWRWNEEENDFRIQTEKHVQSKN